jgi:hypothetical protein
MRKTLKLTESSLRRIVRKLIKEQVEGPQFPPFEGVGGYEAYDEAAESVLGHPPRFLVQEDGDDDGAAYEEVMSNLSYNKKNYFLVNLEDHPDNSEGGEETARVYPAKYKGQPACLLIGGVNSPATYTVVYL